MNTLTILKDVKKIRGFDLYRCDTKINENIVLFDDDYEPCCLGMCDETIFVDEANSVIAFKLQEGSVEVKGSNGCSVDSLIQAAQWLLEGLDGEEPSERKKKASSHLRHALLELDAEFKEET